VRPHKYVAADAAKLGLSNLKLAKVSKLDKFYRDGSETYWESWYRMYRKKGMWIWSEPNGRITADKLAYAASPTYFFGWPNRKHPNKKLWTSVTSCQITKGTQTRVGEVWVFGERGDIGFLGKAKDPSIKSWKRKPLKIFTSSHAKNRADAVREAWEEIFEGKVGALEIVLTIPLSEVGQLVKQDRMAFVNIPEMGISNIFYVVGCQLMGSKQDGYVMSVRLREKFFAISRRVPDDPVLVQDDSEDIAPGEIGDVLKNAGVRWGSAFASASQEFHDGWDLGLFLGVLLSICHHESSFRNVRGGGDIEWYPQPTVGDPEGVRSLDEAIRIWRSRFANAQKNPLNPRYPASETAVGPMQLVTPGFKVWADEYGGKKDEYSGGRWMPFANIRAGARAFAGKLSGLDPKTTANIWIGVERYYGSGDPSRDKAYRDAVHAIWKAHYESLGKSIDDTAATVKKGRTTQVTVPDENGSPFQVMVPTSAPTPVKVAINFALRQRGKPYQWGSSGPNTFDCSGLAVAAYLEAGHRLPGRTTYDFVKKGNGLITVAKDELLSGDLVFFADGTDVHHMGIYLNDGHMIHAPHTGDVVKITAINQGWYKEQYYGARRVVAWRSRGD
jgi:cell wall-associated NlpC family hydrolase